MQVQKTEPGYKLVKTKYRGTYEIPISWELTKFGKEIEMKYGKGLIESTRTHSGFSVYGSGGKVDEHEKFLVKGPGLIVGRKGTLGSVFYESNNFFPIDTVYYITKNETNYDLKFLYYYLKHLKLELYKIVTAKPGISREEVYTIYVTKPQFIEQQKIASILSNVDLFIQHTNEITQQTKYLKKGLVQKLLTKGIGHTKFKKIDWLFGKTIQIPENWILVKVEKLVKNKRDIKTGPFGSTLKKESFVSKGYKVYGQEQVIPNDFTLGNYYIDKDHFTKLKEYEIKPNDILISLVGTHGKISLVPENIEPGIINPRLLKIRFDKSKALPEYMKILFESKLIEIQILKYAQGLTMDILNTKILKKILFPIPTLPEQEKIVAIISNLEKNTDFLVNQKENLQNPFQFISKVN